MNRRENLKWIVGASAAAVYAGGSGPQAFAQAPALPAPAPAGPFKLPPLGYEFDALEPHIDAMTMMVHHDRHHAAYVNMSNQAAEKWPELAKLPIETVLADLTKVPEAVRLQVRNNLGGHYTHSFFWELMTPKGAKAPVGDLSAAINAAFGNVQAMMDKVNAAGATRFGSGWAWLVINKDKKLDVISTANQDTPLELGAKPVIAVDVWEHAYYLKYQNRRPDYLKAWWNTVNWDKAETNFKKATS
jgi:Fe-Mn family superoxide dismutase